MSTNNKVSYQELNNKPMGCMFCGNVIPKARIVERKDPKTKEVIQECHWICGRCGNVSRIGKMRK
jgi:hypothetical protein